MATNAQPRGKTGSNGTMAALSKDIKPLEGFIVKLNAAFFFEKVLPIPNDIVTFVSTMAGKLNKDMSPVESPSHVDTKPTDKADQRHIEEAKVNKND